MKIKNRCISALVTAAIVLGMFSPFGGMVQKVEAAGNVTETLFSDSVLNSLKLQPKSFEHNGSTNANATLAMNFTEESRSHISTSRYSGYGQYLGSGSYYPMGHNYYRSSDFEVADAWHIYFNWYPTDDQMDILNALITSDNTLQISGRYDGYYDTQAGKNAGQTWMRIAQAKSGARIADTETKISTSVSKATFHAQALSWVTLKDDSSFTHFELDLGATKGASGAFVDDKNHARFANPEFYIRDTTSPSVKSITVVDSDKNYVSDEKITVEVKFSEPIRVNGDYSSAFTLKNDVLGTFTPVSYSDYTQTLRYELTVPDHSNAQITKGNFSLNFSWNASKVTDIAGNTMDSTTSSKSHKDESVIVSGYVPRISRIEYVSAQIKDGSYYTVTNSLQGSVKPGDILYFDIYFNQGVCRTNLGISSMNIHIGTETVTATYYDSYLDTKIVPLSETFNRLRYQLEIPTDVDDGKAIVLAANNSGGYWNITDNAAWLASIQGNLIISDTGKRRSVAPVTQIKSSGNYILPEIKIDGTAPELNLTDVNGNSAPVYKSAEDAAAAGTLYNSYEIYVKSDEEVKGSVSAVLKYKPKNGSDVKSSDTMTTGAYTTNPVKDMCLKFSIPANIDSKTYDIWLEVTATDMIYNEGTTVFYLAADTLAPNIAIDKDSSGMITMDGDNKAWKYEFDVSDNASEDGMKLYYRFNGETEFFSDNDTDFTVVSEDYAKDAIISGLIEYYAVDGMGNKSVTGADSFIMTDTGSICELAESNSVDDVANKFDPPRDVEFTGFKAPVTTDAGTVNYYLVYRVGLAGSYKAIISENGENLYIPAEELQQDCVIYYWMVLSTEAGLADSMTEESLEMLPHGELIYRCDDEAPGLKIELEENHVGNNEFLMITAPTGDHPANITKMEMALYGAGGAQIGETLNVTELFVREGAVIASMSLENVLKKFELPSGEYSVDVTLTDANEHSETYRVLENEPIIKDAPVLTEMQILTADGDVVSAVEADGFVVIDMDKLAEYAQPYSFNNGFMLSTKVMIRYEGKNFPSSELGYSFSDDSGATWSSYSDAGMTINKQGTEEVNGETYNYYIVTFPLPVSETHGESSLLVRMEYSKNPYISEPVRVSTLNDTVEPLISVIETAEGSDENGWYDVDYTNEYIKLAIDAADIGIFTDVVGIYITDMTDKNGNTVDSSDYDEYIELYENSMEAVVKQNCTVEFTAADAWGSTATTIYVCGWIDDLTTGVYVYDKREVDTELYTYFTIRNYSDFVLAAVEPGVTEITEADIARFEEISYINSGEYDDDDDDEDKESEAMLMSYALVTGTATTELVEVETLATMVAVRNGDLNSALRIYQRQLSAQPYDIVCGVYDRRGNMQVYLIMSMVNETEEIVVEDFTSSVTNIGNAVNAVQVLSFNKPVAQLDDDLVEEIIENGYTPTRNDIIFRELAFSDTICAVIEDDNVRSDTVAEVYVTDVYGQIAKIDIDITGTTFIDYEGYSINYFDNGEQVDDDHIFGENSEITLEISGNDGVSVIYPINSWLDITVNEESITTVGSVDYYSDVEMKLERGKLSGEGYFHTANLRIRNVNSGEEYTDAIVFQYDTKPPVLVDAVEMLRQDPSDPGRVVYIFYDRRYVEHIYEKIGDEYAEQPSLNGIYYAQYIENTDPVVAAVDCDGNSTDDIGGPNIDDIIVSSTLREGVDFELIATDRNGNTLTEGEYYKTVYAQIQHIEGGKNFTVEPSGVVEAATESPIIFKLTDENGGSTLYQYTAPIDRTPPTVTTVQNNAGGMVTQIIYTITATDVKSGIARVYLPGGNADGTDHELTAETDDPNKYIFTTRNPQDFTLIAEDNLGNTTEKLLSSNSAIVGELEVEAAYHPSTGYTNTGVRVSLSSADGRRIYLSVLANKSDLTAADYLISGSDIYITKNGTLTVLCSDEIGSRTEKVIVVTNVDKTAPAIHATVEAAYYDGKQEIDPTRMRVSFTATSEGDNIPGQVFLLRKTDAELTFTSNAIWDEYKGDILALWADYQKNPEKFKYDEDFIEIANALYKHDIYMSKTYVDVTTNGTHLFYFADSAGNTTTLEVPVTGIDDVAPKVSSVAYSYNYPTGEKYDTLTPKEGTVSLDTDKNLYLVDKTDNRPVTNQSVTVKITVNEPVVLYGSGSTDYSTTVSKVFTNNGTYAFNLMDKAGNIAQVNVEVANILKRAIHIELASPDALVLFEGNTAGYDPTSLEKFSVYTYSGENKVEITPAKTDIDYGTFKPDDLTANKFSRSNPYVIHYTAWDEAGNKAELTKQVILCAKNDIVVMIDGVLPDASGNAYVDGTLASATVQNYGDLTASVRFAKGQYNGAQMKTRGTVVTAVDGKYALNFYEGEGWYTLYVRTLYQDLFVVRIYAGMGKLDQEA